MKIIWLHNIPHIEIRVMPLQTFEEKIDSLEPEEIPSILLAKGFSQAWDHNIFNYQNLLQRANFGARDANIKCLSVSLVMKTLKQIERQWLMPEDSLTLKKFKLSSTTLHQLLFGNSKYHIVRLEKISQMKPWWCMCWIGWNKKWGKSLLEHLINSVITNRFYRTLTASLSY